MLWDENQPGHARDAGDSPGVVRLIFCGHFGEQTGKTAKRCERGIFGKNLCAIAHGLGGRPKVWACCRPKIDWGMAGRLRIIPVWGSNAPMNRGSNASMNRGTQALNYFYNRCMGLGYYFVSTVGESLKELVGVFNEWKLQGFPIQIVFGFNTKFGGEKVVLPLLALGGIALWINYCHRRRQQEVDDTKEDYLSKLPDDVLCSILRNLTVCDAARTTILSTRVRFNSLMTLTLSGAVLTNGHLEGILSSCSNLKKLTIECSKLPSTLQLTGTVIDVVILECDRGQEIDLHAAYLRTLECSIRNDNSYIFGDHARDLPWVKSLTLEFLPGQNYFPIANPTEMKTSRKLTILRLRLVTSHAISQIFELSRLLSDFPLLQSLSFVVVKVAIQMEMRGSGRPPSLQGHNRLKEVIYCGFDGSEVEMEFVVYILKCAIVLEQVFLSPRVISYFSSVPHPKANLSFSEEKRNSIQQKLHGQAFSSKARVVIQ
ncbi:hypothetical protein CQW23_18321 [Capsicum baccatum]|uniref:F-box/LRR-repeat protein 15/At3g58940/PEG3-like LRR domain-containing protein n=1 Tax=Capsicum baccatum TaxID=33114 RepID=A0A2G2WGB9_CAPBA|nr:hypothetical protein CQW23_18321 [Capsicum baccatum]